MSLNIAEPDIALETEVFVGRSVAVLGITGSGKTNTAAVLIEELLTQGLPMTIVDIEGEYWGLKESYDLLIVGRSEHAELEIGPENAAQLFDGDWAAVNGLLLVWGSRLRNGVQLLFGQPKLVE